MGLIIFISPETLRNSERPWNPVKLAFSFFLPAMCQVRHTHTRAHTHTHTHSKHTHTQWHTRHTQEQTHTRLHQIVLTRAHVPLHDCPIQGKTPIRKLILLRHADAGFPPNTKDHERPITQRGVQQAISIADEIRKVSGGGPGSEWRGRLVDQVAPIFCWCPPPSPRRGCTGLTFVPVILHLY